MLRAHETAGSNPAVLTVVLHCGGTRAGTGRWLLTALTQVRFLPPQLIDERALGRAAKVPAFQAGEVGSIPTGHSVDRVGSSAAEQVPVKYQRAGSSPARPSEIDAG